MHFGGMERGCSEKKSDKLNCARAKKKKTKGNDIEYKLAPKDYCVGREACGRCQVKPFLEFGAGKRATNLVQNSGQISFLTNHKFSATIYQMNKLVLFCISVPKLIKGSTIVNCDSRVVLTLNLPVLILQSRIQGQFLVIRRNVLIRLVTICRVGTKYYNFSAFESCEK